VRLEEPNVVVSGFALPAASNPKSEVYVNGGKGLVAYVFAIWNAAAVNFFELGEPGSATKEHTVDGPI